MGIRSILSRGQGSCTSSFNLVCGAICKDGDEVGLTLCDDATPERAYLRIGKTCFYKWVGFRPFLATGAEPEPPLLVYCGVISEMLINRRDPKAWTYVVALSFASTLGGGCTREVAEAPPPPQLEVITVAPDPDCVWISGYWDWN
jgi:hypothetical protein